MNKTIIDRVADITGAAEEITDELTHSAGMIITKATPLLAPTSSGLTILFAVYDGVGRMLEGHITNPYLWSLVAGFLLMLAVEGINFAGTFVKDRVDHMRPLYKSVLENVSGNGVAAGAFWLTVSTVFFLESLPGIVAWWNGSMQISDATFRVGLLILPVFSKVGAKIFSLSALLDSLEGAQEVRRARRLNNKKAELELELELEMKRKERTQTLELRAAEHAQKLKLREKSADGKIGEIDDISDFSPISPGDKEDRVARMREGKARKIAERRKTILGILGGEELSVSDLAQRAGCSPKTVQGDLAALQDAGHSMSVNGVVKLNQ